MDSNKKFSKIKFIAHYREKDGAIQDLSQHLEEVSLPRTRFDGQWKHVVHWTLERGRENGKGFICSMSRKGNCWDNAPMEAFWGKMKYEWLHEQHFKTRDEARAAVFEYIEIFYNRQRLHESNRYLTPEEYYSAAIAA